MAGFSGYIAIDELYDGPFCYLSPVDAQNQRRILFHVLEGTPEKADIALLLSRFKWKDLRNRLKRLKKLSKSMGRLASANTDKSLVYLDAKGFPGTSNAVERGNRRHRKMQKSVYRVRTLKRIRQRVSLDMLREQGFQVRVHVFEFLHDRRCG